jgi:predicted dinucleotide-binding enzyme
MSIDTPYAILGTGNIGSALARLFGRAGLEVRIANTRGPNYCCTAEPSSTLASRIRNARDAAELVHFGGRLTAWADFRTPAGARYDSRRQ